MRRLINRIDRLRSRRAGSTGPPRDWLEYTNDAARLLYMEIDYEQVIIHHICNGGSSPSQNINLY